MEPRAVTQRGQAASRAVHDKQPVPARDEQGVFGQLTPDDVRLVHPTKVRRQQVSITQAQLKAVADGPARLQTAFNRAATTSFAETTAVIRELLAEPAGGGDPDAVPLWVKIR